MSTFTHSFDLFGEPVTVETNSSGDRLYITYGDTVIEDSSGDCVRWPDNLMLLYGAALDSATNKVLRDAAISSIRDFIYFAASELRAD